MIIIRLDRVLADRKMRLNELAARVGISNVNLSYLKTGKVRAIRFSTLDAICKALRCQPGDILEYIEGDAEDLPRTACEAARPQQGRAAQTAEKNAPFHTDAKK